MQLWKVAAPKKMPAFGLCGIIWDRVACGMDSIPNLEKSPLKGSSVNSVDSVGLKGRSRMKDRLSLRRQDASRRNPGPSLDLFNTQHSIPSFKPGSISGALSTVSGLSTSIKQLSPASRQLKFGSQDTKHQQNNTIDSQ